jgi:hypothetical protein
VRKYIKNRNTRQAAVEHLIKKNINRKKNYLCVNKIKEANFHKVSV